MHTERHRQINVIVLAISLLAFPSACVFDGGGVTSRDSGSLDTMSPRDSTLDARHPSDTTDLTPNHDALRPLDADLAAPDTFTPDTFTPDTFTPDTFTPDTFTPDTLAPPPPDTLYAFPAPLSGITVDCDLSEWTGGWLSIAAPPDWVSTGGSAQNAQDLSARFAARWNATDLYLAFEVTDDIHQNAKGADTEHLWQDDSVQIGLDMAQNGGSSYDNTDDFEYGWAITTAGAQIRYRWYAPTGSPAMQNTFAVRRSDTTTSYEIKLPLSDIGLSSLTAGVRFSFSALVNENDGQGREGYIEWTSGIGQSKTPANFGEIILQP